MDDDTVYYAHEKLDGGRFVTVAYMSLARTDGHIPFVAYGVAYCSAQDQFSRKRGRLIAHGRMLKVPGYRSLPADLPTDRVGRSRALRRLVMEAVLTHLPARWLKDWVA